MKAGLCMCIGLLVQGEHAQGRASQAVVTAQRRRSRLRCCHVSQSVAIVELFAHRTSSQSAPSTVSCKHPHRVCVFWLTFYVDCLKENIEYCLYCLYQGPAVILFCGWKAVCMISNNCQSF